MLRFRTFILPVFALGLALSPVLFAQSQSMSGKITEIDKKNNTVTIQPASNESGIPEKIELFLKPDADLKGVDSVRDLNVGDEVRFEAEQQNAWFASSLETAVVKTDEKDEVKNRDGAYTDSNDKNIFQRAWGNVRSTWFSYRGESSIDPDNYTRYAEAYITNSEAQIEKLKSKASDASTQQEYDSEMKERTGGVVQYETMEQRQDSGNESTNRDGDIKNDTMLDSGKADNTPERKQLLISEANSNLEIARQELGGLKQVPAYFDGIYDSEKRSDGSAEKAIDSQSPNKTLTKEWSEARKKTDTALKNLRASVQKASGAILPQKQRYEVTSQYEISKMKYDLDELKTAQKNPVRSSSEDVQGSIDELERKVAEAETDHKKLEGASKEDWRNIQDQLQNNFDSFRSTHSDVSGKLAA